MPGQPLVGSPTLAARVPAHRPVRRHVRSAARRPPGHRGQRAPRAAARPRHLDGGQRALAEAGQPGDHARSCSAWRWSRPRSRDVDGLEAGRLEIDHGGPSYTADTLRDAGGVGIPDAELFTIVGDDAAAGITTWARYDEVVARSSLVVVDRPGAPVELPAGFDWIRVEVPRLEVSSTDLRARFDDGRPLDYLVTQPVLDVIARDGLYRRMTAARA